MRIGHFNDISVLALLIAIGFSCPVVAQQSASGKEEPIKTPLHLRVTQAGDVVAAKKRDMEQTYRDFLAARANNTRVKMDLDATSTQREDAKRAFDLASAEVTQASRNFAKAANDKRDAINEAAKQGVVIPDPTQLSSESENPLGATAPHRHIVDEGTLFRYLKNEMEPDHRAQPDSAGQWSFDGRSKREYSVDVVLGQVDTARAEVLVAAAHAAAEADRLRRAAEVAARAEREQATRDAEMAKQIQRQKEIDAYVAYLRKEVNRHVDSAKNVDTTNPSAVQKYNDYTDYLIEQYKRYTGEDLTFKYKAP